MTRHGIPESSASRWIAIVVSVIVLTVSISFNVIQASALAKVEETKSTLQDHEVRIRHNTEALVELRYIRQQLNRIEEKIDKEQN